MTLLNKILFILFAVLIIHLELKCQPLCDSDISKGHIYESYKLSGVDLKLLSEKILYKKTPQVDLYLYLLRPISTSKKPLSAVIYFTGGGWVNGDVENTLPTAAWFRDQGIIGISADYRVKSKHGTGVLECIEDAKSAVRYVRMHAKELGIDPRKIIVAGGSAGGHLAACTFLAGGDAFGEDLTISTVPNALLLHNPVTGLGFRKDFFSKYPQFSPINNVRKGWPPTVISNGTLDSITTYKDAITFVNAIKNVGSDVQLITVKNAGHSCDWPNSNPNFLPTITAMTQFLVKHHFIKQSDVTLQPITPDSLYPAKSPEYDCVSDWSKNHYMERMQEFKKKPVSHSNIVMVGNSITEGGKDWSLRLKDNRIVNRGISGDIAEGVLERIDEICFSNPKAIFLMIGINDINGCNRNADQTIENIRKVVLKIKKSSPKTSIFLQTILPTSRVELKSIINQTNLGIKRISVEEKCVFIDVNIFFSGSNGLIIDSLTKDGIHLNENGYECWSKILKPYILKIK